MIPVLIGVILIGYGNPIIKCVKNTKYKIEMSKYNHRKYKHHDKRH